MPSSSSLVPGQKFARYVIEATIGQGGMGEVYRAYDEQLRRKVALKVIHPDFKDRDAAARLQREARAAAALTHPNTVAIHDLGEVDGTVFLVMELVSGASLRAYVGDSKIGVARKLRWLAGIARGLAAAHRAGLIHRDVKPSNVMITDDDGVKVLDFGLAKPLEAASFRTDAGIVVGTPGYMAPELFTGAPADARTDQYAFGVTAYELLSGEHPGNPLSGTVPVGLDERSHDVSPHIARVIARTLSRSPKERYESMSDVANALETDAHAPTALATRVEARTAVGPVPTSSQPTRVIVIALAALVVGAGGFLALHGLPTETPLAEVDAAIALPPAVDAAALEVEASAPIQDAAPEAEAAAIDDASPDVFELPPNPYDPADDFQDPWKKDAAR